MKMKLYKKILIGILVFLVLLLGIAFFLPRDFKVSVTQNVEAPPNYVYNFLNDFKNIPEWDPWMKGDETMTFELGDLTMGEGGSYSWTSEKSGSGVATRKEGILNEVINLEIESPEMGIAQIQYLMKSAEKGSEMTWNFEAKSGFPFNLFNFFIKSSVAKQFKKGIANIDAVTTERAQKGMYDGYQISEEVIEDRTYITQRDEVSFENAEQYYAQNLAPLFLKIQSAGVDMTGKPCALFYSWDSKKKLTDMATAVPIDQEVMIADADAEILPASKVLVVNYYGSLSGTITAHQAIDDYMRDRNLTFNYPVVEEHVTDPSEEKDPSKWLTRVIYYLAG